MASFEQEMARLTLAPDQRRYHFALDHLRAAIHELDRVLLEPRLQSHFSRRRPILDAAVVALQDQWQALTGVPYDAAVDNRPEETP